MGFLSDVVDVGKNLLGGITGKGGADAASAGQEAMLEATRLGIESREKAQKQLREDLEPFVDFGAGFIPRANQAYRQSADLFGPNADQAIMNNPMFTALMDKAQQDILSNQAVRGRVGTGETPMFLQESALRTGFDILNNERSAALQNRASILQALGIGQSSAAQVGTAGVNTASGIADLYGQRGNAIAAGEVGQANAWAGGAENLIGIGKSIFAGMG